MNAQNSNTKTAPKMEISEKRNFLRQLTKNLIANARPQDQDKKPNDLIKDFYRKRGHKVLKSFNEWKEAGYSVKRGEHALLLWGKPKGGVIIVEKIEDTGSKTMEEVSKIYFPLCYVFSNKQVQKVTE